MVQRDNFRGQEVTERQAGLKSVFSFPTKILPLLHVKYRTLYLYEVLFHFTAMDFEHL